MPPPASDNVIVSPGQTVAAPDIADGNAFTVIISLVEHPVGNVYIIVEVPVDPLVTNPVVDPIVATVVLLLVHVPPPASVRVAVEPIHIPGLPDMADGSGFTVTTSVAIHPVEDKV